MTATENQEKAKEQEKEQELEQYLEQECEPRSERQHDREHAASQPSPATHEDDFCERRRQQNREAQRRFRNKRAKEREAEALQAHPLPASTGSSGAVPSSIASFTPILAPNRDLNDFRSFSFNALPHATAGPGGSDSRIVASCLPLITSSPNLYPEDLLGQDFILGPDIPLPNIDPHAANIVDLMSSVRDLGEFSVPSIGQDTVQSSFPDTHGDLDGTYTWIDYIGLDLLFREQLSPPLSSGRSLEWSEQQSLLDPPAVEKANQSISRPPAAPTRDYPEGSEDSPALLARINSQQRQPSLHPDHPDISPPDSRQVQSITKPMPPISPLQQPKPPTKPTNDTKVGTSQSLLHMAIDSGHEGIIRIVLDQGVDINEKNSDGSTALHMAVQRRQENILPLLLEKGADVNALDGDGRTPIHMAIYSDFQTGLKLLLGQKP